MARHSRVCWAVLCFLLSVFASAQQRPQTQLASLAPASPEPTSLSAGQQAPAIQNDVVIRGGTLLTVTHGRIENGSIYIHNGKIAAVGKTVQAPSNATVIDATGKWVMPGIIDAHSHIALDDDVNEATSPVTPQMMMRDAFDYNDKLIYRALA